MTCSSNTRVPDPEFRSDTELDQLPCVGSDRLLVSIAESVVITNVCQDENNTSIVYVEFRLNGVFDFTPRLSPTGPIGCGILAVDGDISYESDSILAPWIPGYFRSEPKTMPINTECETRTYTLAFDFGRVIPDFLGARHIFFTLRLEGVLPPSLGVFTNLHTVVEEQHDWIKGPTPNPYRLHYDTSQDKLYIYFQFEQGVPCNCNILCESITGDIRTVQYCPDQTSRVLVDYAAGDDPTSLLFQFSDGFGNNSDLRLLPLVNTLPAAPFTIPKASPRRVEVGISRTSVGGTKLDEGTAYQIWKYEGSISNARIWKDWSSRSYSTFSDTEVVPGRAYGYAVRYQGTFGEQSRLSGWSTAVV